MGLKLDIFKHWSKKCKRLYPQTDLKGIPHIKLKIHVWKKDYGGLVTMLSCSGIGWNVEQTRSRHLMMNGLSMLRYYAQIVVFSEILILDVDANARLMRNKSWPFYNDWVMIFGKDRATGEHAEDFTEVLNHVLNGMSIPQEDTPINLENLSENGEDETETNSFCQAESTPQTLASEKKGKGRKRNSVDGVDPMYDVMKTFCRNTDSRLGDIAKQIGYGYAFHWQGMRSLVSLEGYRIKFA
ncbi:hypothetical protein DH2020_039649 [Rehmannia glutinosa]|uniref:DUF4283 domain-containing protein n=1 Tax=Rehmannia glutinosa TaxID=99300 RepID=A0ABR0UWD9_REHGL